MIGSRCEADRAGGSGEQCARRLGAKRLAGGEVNHARGAIEDHQLAAVPRPVERQAAAPGADSVRRQLPALPTGRVRLHVELIMPRLVEA